MVHIQCYKANCPAITSFSSIKVTGFGCPQLSYNVFCRVPVSSRTLPQTLHVVWPRHVECCKSVDLVWWSLVHRTRVSTFVYKKMTMMPCIVWLICDLWGGLLANETVFFTQCFQLVFMLKLIDRWTSMQAAIVICTFPTRLALSFTCMSGLANWWALASEAEKTWSVWQVRCHGVYFCDNNIGNIIILSVTDYEQFTRSTQPCIPLGLLNQVPALIGWGKGRNVTTAGWQVTLCDSI